MIFVNVPNEKNGYLQSSIEVSELIYVAYDKFGHITTNDIDKLRLKYRLKVVQVSVSFGHKL